MAQFVKEFKARGLVDVYKNEGLQAACSSISEFISEKREEILLAWWAEHGFAPGRAVMISGYEDGHSVCGIRECTDAEQKTYGLEPK